jgi:threonylcarbamoyladenosine tRNA methylthiotransferase MtaB
LHVFRYSKRAGTRAAAAPDQVSDSIKKDRSALLLQCTKVLEEQFGKNFFGQEMEVLFEEQKACPADDGKVYWYGLTSNYVRIKYQSDDYLENKFKKVKIQPENLA